MQERRVEKLNHLIEEKISEIIKKELGLPLDMLLTVTEVKVDQRLVEAKIWLSIFPDQEAEFWLNKIIQAKGFLHALLKRKINVYHCPNLRFYLNPVKYSEAELNLFKK